MKKSKKLLSLLLAFVMVFGVVSSVMVASAADNKKQLEYNDTISKKNVDDFINILDDMVKDLVPTLIKIDNFDLDLDAFADGSYYTNRNAAELIRTIYKFLGTINFSGISLKFQPADVFSAIQNQSMKDAYKAAVDAGNSGNSFDTWDALDFSNVYFGFKDGDREGFLDAIIDGFSYMMHDTIYVFEMMGQPLLSGKDGYYNKLIIPLMQTLGVTEYPSVEDYSPPLDGSVYGQRFVVASTYLKPILVPLLDFLEGFAKAPVKTLLSLLPNIVYSFEQGRLDELLNMLAGMEGVGDVIGMIKNDDGSINHDIVGLLNGVISGITNALVPGVEFGLPALDIDWTSVMKKYGTVTAIANMEQKDPQYVINPVDSSDMFMYVYNYLADALAMEGNQRLIKAVLVLLGLDEDTSKMILEIVTMDRQSLLVTVMGLLGVDGLETPDDKNDPTTDPSKDPADGDGSGSGDAEIPQTGDVALSAFAMLAVAGAAGLVITKKKED